VRECAGNDRDLAGLHVDVGRACLAGLDMAEPPGMAADHPLEAETGC
jgi:hypothetical protein